jgi:hypothetical protein
MRELLQISLMTMVLLVCGVIPIFLGIIGLIGMALGG